MKKKFLALSLILTLAVTALSGCDQNGETETGGVQSSKPQTSSFVTTEPIEDDLTSPDEWDTESEPKREIKTSAETREEVIALFLKAFSEKDSETLRAFHCGNFDESYNEMFNLLCKALDDEGNLPEDVNEIDLNPSNFEVFHITRKFDIGGQNETWEATYTPANGHFTIYFRDFSDYDYISKTYSAEFIQIYSSMRYMNEFSLDGYRQLAASGESYVLPYSGAQASAVYIESVDITPYFD